MVNAVQCSEERSDLYFGETKQQQHKRISQQSISTLRMKDTHLKKNNVHILDREVREALYVKHDKHTLTGEVNVASLLPDAHILLESFSLYTDTLLVCQSCKAIPGQ